MRAARRSYRLWGPAMAVFSMWAAVALAEAQGGPVVRPEADDRGAVTRGDEAVADDTAKRDGRQRREGWRDRGDRSDPPGAVAGERPRGPRYMGGAGETSEDRDFLTAEERERLRDFAKEHFPELAERLKTGRVPQRVAWPLLRLMRMQKSDPELAAKLIEEHRIEMKLMEYRRGYKEAPPGTARENLRKSMRELLEQRFDVRQARLELEIRDLQKRIERARERLARQQANKAQIVDGELEHLTDTVEEASGGGEDRPSTSATPGGPAGPGPRSERRQARGG